jgi:PKD repeat protein
VPGGRLFEVAPDSAYSSAVNFNWNFGTGAVPETSFEAGDGDFIAGVAGTNTATLTLQFGPCQATFSADYVVEPFPIAEVAPQTSFCEGLSFTFENNSQFATTYSWFFGHAGNNNSAAFEPEHTFPSTGNYLVQLIADPGSACADTAFAEIVILPEDPIVLEYTLAVPGPCDTSNVVQFTFTGEGADDILWQAGDGTEYGTETAVHVYGEPGTYTVQLEAYNGLCDVTESTSVEIDVFPGPLPYPVAIPNVFTPNGDAINDTFHLFFELAPGVPVELPGNKSIYDYLEDYQLQVYNRWGALLFDSSNGIMEWSGDDYADGTYYALIRFQRRCLDDSAKEIGRHFTLLR